jgi:hypothetical protein
MATPCYTDARIFGGLPVDVTAMFAGTDDAPESVTVYWRNGGEVSPAVYAKMTRDDWDAIDAAIWAQWH